jgi:hypothetical protein
MPPLLTHDDPRSLPAPLARAQSRRAYLSGVRVREPRKHRKCERLRGPVPGRANSPDPHVASLVDRHRGAFHAVAIRGRRTVHHRPLVLHARRTGAAWELPIVPKFHLLRRSVTPFVGVGPTFRRLAMQGQNTTIPLSPPPGQPVTSITIISETRWQTGLCLAGGVEFRTSAVRFSPELRYSRWSPQSACEECGPYTLPLARSSATVLMLGISF